MSNIILMKGLPGSGKSTLAHKMVREQVGYARVNKDDLRASMPSYQLFMRETDDKRKDHVVKLELYKKYIDGNYNVEAVFDDRQRVVDMWRDIGLTVFQVADGNF